MVRVCENEWRDSINHRRVNWLAERLARLIGVLEAVARNMTRYRLYQPFYIIPINTKS